MKPTPIILLILTLAMAEGAWSQALGATSPWKPQASERLIKLPTHLLTRTLDRDYEESELAARIGDSNEEIKLKTQTLQDLKRAVGESDGDVGTELKHQYLAEKQRFIELMGAQQELYRARARAKVKVYTEILDKLKRSGVEPSAVERELIQNQSAALKRFGASSSTVDMELFGSGELEESRYGVEYAKNRAAIDRLVRAIGRHPMTAEPTLNGEVVGKADYVRGLLSRSEAELAILDQEEDILGFMAKLVALDAMALAEGIESESDFVVNAQGEEEAPLLGAVDHFVN